MPQPKQRIVVDGVDFQTVFQFPRVLRAVTVAMQPPRMVVALLMVVSLIALGRLWDGVIAEPRIGPQGLLAELTDEEAETHRVRLWSAVDDYGIELALPRAHSPDAGRVLEELDRSYRTRRQAVIEGLVELEDRSLRDEDERFAATRAAIAVLVPRGPFAATSDVLTGAVQRLVRGVAYLRPQMIFRAGRDVFVGLPAALWRGERSFAIVFGLMTLVVLSVGGGALCRMAACEFAGQERLRVAEAFDFALGNWVKLVVTPILPLLIVGAAAVFLLVIGLLFAPWLDVLGGLLYGLALLVGLVMALLLLGYAFGFPLLLPAVACENCDAADAQQRAYAYVLNRPLHLLGYGVLAVIGLALGYVAVSLVASTLLNVTATLVGAIFPNTALLAAGGFSMFDLHPERPGAIQAAWHNGFAAGAVSFWQRLIVDLVAAYVVAYLFSASTIVYLLMRRACDGQDVEEIWQPGLEPGTLVPLPRPRIETDDGGGVDTPDTEDDRGSG